MTKQIASGLLNPVPSRTRNSERTPLLSSLQTDGAMADRVPLEVRRERVQRGSRRLRDVEAVRVADELEAIERLGEITLTGEAQLHWVNTVHYLRLSVPPATFALWLTDLYLVGVQGETAFLSCPDEKRSWVARRYATLIVECLQAADAPYTEVSFSGVLS